MRVQYSVCLNVHMLMVHGVAMSLRMISINNGIAYLEVFPLQSANPYAAFVLQMLLALAFRVNQLHHFLPLSLNGHACT